MAYATQSHVEARNSGRGTFSSSTKPTASQVGLFIEEAAATIDEALLYAGYSVPIAMATTSTPSAAQGFLQLTNSYGAAYMVECSAQTASGKREEFQALWEKALEMIRVSGLPGMTIGSNSSRTPRTNSVATPFFSRDMVL